MFIAATFTIAKVRKQLQCPSVAEWMEPRRCTSTAECYSAPRKEDVLPSAGTGTGLEHVRPGRVHQSETGPV